MRVRVKLPASVARCACFLGCLPAFLSRALQPGVVVPHTHSALCLALTPTAPTRIIFNSLSLRSEDGAE